MLSGGNEEHFVVGLDHRRTFRNDGVSTASEYCRDPGVHPGHVFANLLQFPPNDGPACDGLHGDQPDSPLGKIEHLQRAGVGDQLLDIFCDELLWADDDIDRNGTRFK